MCVCVCVCVCVRVCVRIFMCWCASVSEFDQNVVWIIVHKRGISGLTLKPQQAVGFKYLIHLM